MAITHKPSPNHRKRPSSTASRSWNRTPDRHGRNSGHSTRPRPSHASSNRARVRRRSYSPSPSRRSTKASRPSPDHRKFDPNDDTFYDGRLDAKEFAAGLSTDGEQDEGDEEESFFYWEEETTLFSELLEEGPDESKDHEWHDLVDSLQPSFDQRDREMKKEIAETIVPIVNRVKGLYKKIDTDVDETFGKGILIFNKACKDMEAMAIRDQDEFKHTWALAQRNIQEIFTQLNEAYKARDRLWSDFEKAMDETVEPALELLKGAPAKIERTIANLEKHARSLEKDDTSAISAAEKKIKGLLGKAS